LNQRKPSKGKPSTGDSSGGNTKPAGGKSPSQSASGNSRGGPTKSKSSRNRKRKRNPKNKSGSGKPAQAQAGGKQGNRQSAKEPKGPKKPTEDFSKHTPTDPRNYKVKFFDNFKDARSDLDGLKTLCDDCDQLNVVVRAEGDMTDPEILGIDPKIKLFAGEAWSLIHDRRVEDQWYESPQ